MQNGVYIPFLCVYGKQIPTLLAFRMASHMLDCGWIKDLGRLFQQLLPLVLPINT